MAWEQVSVPIIARVMNADVTFCPSNYGPLFAPNLVIMLRNGLAVAGSERRIHKLLYWFSLGLMTAVCLLACRRAIAVSEYARRALTFNLPQRISRKAAVIHHGVDRFRTVRSTRGKRLTGMPHNAHFCSPSPISTYRKSSYR